MNVFVRVPEVVTRQSNLKNRDGSLAVEQAVLLNVQGRLAPLEVSVLLRAGSEPYPVGDYQVDAQSFQSGRYGSVEFRLRIGPKLAPVALGKAA